MHRRRRAHGGSAWSAIIEASSGSPALDPSTGADDAGYPAHASTPSSGGSRDPMPRIRMGSSTPEPGRSIVGLRADPCTVVDQGARTRWSREALLAAAAGRAHDHDEFHIECALRAAPTRTTWRNSWSRRVCAATALSTKRSDRLWPLRLRSLIVGGQFRHRPQPLPVSAAAGRLGGDVAARRTAPQARHDRAQRLGHLRRTDALGDPLDGRARRRRVRRQRRDEAQHARSGRGKRCMTLQHGIDVDQDRGAGCRG